MNLLSKIKKYICPACLVLFVYAMLLLSRWVVSMLSESANEYLTVVVLQLLTFGFPAAIWYRFRKLTKSGRAVLSRFKLNAPRPAHALIIIAACFALMSGCLLFSLSFAGKSSLEGSFSLYDTFVSKYNGTPLGALWLILAYALLPAFGEEIVFRGILCAEYEKYGVVCAVVMNTLWFGFLHFNFAKLVIYLFAGIILSLLLYATRSVISVMIAHFLYNLFGIFGQQYITEFYITAGSVGVAAMILLIILIISLVVFCGSASRVYMGYSKNDPPSDESEDFSKKSLISGFRACLLTPSSAACTILYLAVALILILI